MRREIEELMQETWTRSLGRIDTYEERGLPFAAWLCGVARNVMLERARHRLYPWPEGYEPMSTDSAGLDPLDQVVAEAEVSQQRAAVQAAIAGLSADQRAVVEGRLIVGKCSREVAAGPPEGDRYVPVRPLGPPQTPRPLPT